MSKVVRPFTMTDAALVSSTATEAVALWNSGTNYSLGQQARSDTTHRIYQAVQGSNLNHNPTTDDGTWWLDIGPTNKWAMFDTLNYTQTTHSTDLAVEVDITGRIDSVAALNCLGTAVTIVAENTLGAEVYNETHSLIDLTPITDWWSYFFEEVTYKTDVVVTDIPPYQDMTVTTTIEGGGGATACGVLVHGLSKELGGAQYGSRVGIDDFSRAERDEFGNFTGITQRPFSKRGQFAMFVEQGATDALIKMLAGYRATPVLWVMTDQYTSTQIFGFYKSFEFVLSHPSHHEYDLVLEGVT